MVGDLHLALADAEKARDLGASLVEFRLDHVYHSTDDIPLVQRLVNDSPLPCIITCRPTWEGGDYDGDDDARISLFEHLGAAAAPNHPPRYIDVELAAYARSANLKQKVNLAVDHPAQQRDLSTSLILSSHNFDARPANLFKLVTDMRAEPAAKVLKLAFRARSIRDNLELFEILIERDRPTIALAMGEDGLLSRILAPKFGGFLTFASLRDTSTTAPGQPTVHDLLNLYRFRTINPRTRVYGIIGHPVSHSRSPHIHNAGFEAVNHDGVYVPLPIPPEWEHFKATLSALLDFPPLDFRGASVTIPHKEHLLRFAREDASRPWSIDPLADRAGAANTLIIRDDHSCHIANTDIPGVVEPLRAALGDLTGKHIAILGAGGAARAACVGLTDAGANVTIYNRTPDRAAKLTESLRAAGVPITSAPWNALPQARCDALVHCTPLGMAGSEHVGHSPLTAEQLSALASQSPSSAAFTVMETVYNPLNTPLLAEAHRAGVRTIAGIEMFVTQASEQFEAWTGHPAPKRLFQRICAETLETSGQSELKDN